MSTDMKVEYRDEYWRCQRCPNDLLVELHSRRLGGGDLGSGWVLKEWSWKRDAKGRFTVRLRWLQWEPEFRIVAAHGGMERAYRIKVGQVSLWVRLRLWWFYLTSRKVVKRGR